MSRTTHDVTIADHPVRLTESGEGRPALVLHGGGGPASVESLVAHLEATHHVIAPTHPGWEGTPRPDDVTSVADLADLYTRLLADRDLRDVTVVGSSVGGWVAAELALRDPDHRIGRVVLIDAVGIEVPGEPVVDFVALSPREAAEHSWHDPDRFMIDPATLPAERRATVSANMATMLLLTGGRAMADPGLAPRLAAVDAPVTVVWGDSDRVCTPAYGRAYAAAFPGARFELVADAGHLPHIEQPAATAAVLDAALAR